MFSISLALFIRRSVCFNKDLSFLCKRITSFLALLETLLAFCRILALVCSIAEVKIKMVDYANEPVIDTVILLDTLNSEAPSLSYYQSNKLYNEVQKDYTNIKSKYKRFIKTKENPFFNALNVKFSYALTCHKSQGGQWPTVFIEKPYLKDGVDIDYLRWLYTAVTRAENKLYLIGF